MSEAKRKPGRPAGTVKGGAIKFLNDRELKAFFSAVDKEPDSFRRVRDRLAFRLTLFFGLRVKELRQILLDDLNADGKQIAIRGLKGGRERTYDLIDEITSGVQAWLKKRPAGPYLFPHSLRPDEPIDDGTVAAAFKKYAKRAKLSPSFSVHSLRHSCAIGLAKKGASPIRVMMWLRHRSVESTQVYFEQVQFEGDENRVRQVFADIL